MKAYELTSWLEAHYPAAAAEEWDNVGLLAGDDTKEISHVFLALDLTEETLAEAIGAGAEMIVTHHPMIFSGMKKINNHSFTGRKILTLIRHDIPYYAMHTNYDVLGMAKLSADLLKLTERQVLSPVAGAQNLNRTAVQAENQGGDARNAEIQSGEIWETETQEDEAWKGKFHEGIGRVGNLPESMTLRECAKFVKKAYKLKDVKVYGDLEQIVTRAAVCTGSGKSMIPDAIAAGAQVYVTGDIDHHTGIDTVAQGLALIDAGHYGTEYIFMEAMKKELNAALPELKVTCAEVKSPYTIL